MKEILTHTLSILVAMMLLFVLVAPARAASLDTDPVKDMDTFTDDPPPTPEPFSTQPSETTDGIPQLNLAPVFTFWYGNNQTFGLRGNPQRQINILGNISGETVTTLRYRLNGGTEVTGVPVGTGSTNRLVRPGDFNIALNISSLQVGQNTLQITAGTGSTTFNFNYNPGAAPSLPYTLNWTTASSINNQAQVVDGLWTMTSAGPRTQITGYDRLIALGDMTWTNYEILVPITVHSWPLGNGEGGVGIIANWRGHGGTPTETLPDDWWLMGAYGYYSNKIGSEGGLAMYINQSNRSATGRNAFNLSTGIPYLFKLKVEQLTASTDTQPGTSRYSLKAWPQGQAEPAWGSAPYSAVVNVTDSSDIYTKGGILLVAHNANATFGNVNVCPLTGANYNLSVNTSGQGSVSRSPNKTQYACGEGVSLTAVAAEGWRFVRWEGDVSSNSTTIHTNIVKSTSLTAVFEQTGSIVLDQQVFVPVTRK